MNSLWSYLQANHAQLGRWTVATLWLSTAPLVTGLVAAVPVGWLASRNRVAALILLGGTGALYTVPSLVMFLTLPGLLGTRILDPINVAVALTIYSVALLTRTVTGALSAVPADVTGAATAVGYNRFQLLIAVQLPVALPVIAAGVRAAAVANVSLVSVASIIGTAQLGQLFVIGTNTGSLTPIVLGLLLFVALALVIDLAIVATARILTPWRQAATR